MKERIRLIRKERELSQEEFAKKIGLTKTSISKIETGVNTPSEQTIMSICREFNINEEWLRNGTGSMVPVKDVDFEAVCRSIGVSDPKAKRAIMEYWKLTEQDRELWWKFSERVFK
ncbi:helix-turn-helix domain-containing protein [Lachnospiraceae bacterium NSJ-143]|nr:helix-turn-helix domain-containing protein [Lachnospiraceae bacterium NSJ-143]